MQYCSACQKALATVFVLDMREGAVAAQHNLCQSCAEQQGVVQPKPTALKLPQELLEDLLSAAPKAPGEGKRKAAKEGPACPGCGLTAAEFRTRGRLGCPRCYQTLRVALLPLLERLHDATTHRGRCLVRGAQRAEVPGPEAPIKEATIKEALTKEALTKEATPKKVGPGEAAPTKAADAPAPGGGPAAVKVETLSELKVRLAAAIQAEKYEEAANLRDQIKKREAGKRGAETDQAGGGA
jgi:protein arginine kinase activator